jgi:protein arginine kinase activator
MLCQTCKEHTATIHLTEISNGQRCETHLCQNCAQEQGLAVKTQIPLNDLLNTLLSTQPQAGGQPSGDDDTVESLDSDRACPACGMTLKRFSKESLLGCCADYSEFQKELLPLIQRSQNGGDHHCGKVPSQTPAQDRNDIEVMSLQRQLEAAIKDEDYETAAHIRDKINSYE